MLVKLFSIINAIVMRYPGKYQRHCASTTNIALTFLCLCLAHLPGIAIAQTSYEEMLDQAKNKYYSGALEEARDIFSSLVEQKPGDAYFFLAMIEKASPSSNEYQNTVIEYLRRAVDFGNASAMWELGQSYENGDGVPVDLLVAMDWYRASKSHSNNSPDVIFFDTNRRDLIQRTTEDVIESLKHKAALNDVEAQYRLGNVYDTGYLVQPDEAQAFYWYHQAAKNEHTYSQFVLGYFYCRGIGTEIDVQVANDWLEASGRSASCLIFEKDE
ncbi:tetratricopeptide repeat protein [Nitrincola iocasae]|uniref:Sel1 repeat family protein n=1 Tax=Nitrincola iocasae TaxID=2614693 RepID=A0A5J6LEN0_9GAMM|nr:tetratricopeptide repeat protein [Nitrincola iocasae]QEW07084.1 sel1 repeat family protein [Nitrincola iocasae]